MSLALFSFAVILMLFAVFCILAAIHDTLRRIAIALETLHPKIPDIDHPSLQHNITHYAWEAGRSFEQGRRTDR